MFELSIEEKKILIYYNNIDFISLFKLKLFSTGFEVFETKDINHIFEQLIIDKNIRLLIMCLEFPYCSSFVEYIKNIRESSSFNKIPIMTICNCKSNYLTEEMLCFDAGADLSLYTPFENEDFLIKVKSLVRRSNLLFTENSVKNTFTEEHLHKYSIFIKGKKVSFTPVEYDIFFYLYERSNIIVTTKEILVNVMHYPKGVGNPDLVRTHIKNIRSKLEKDRYEPEILVTVPKKGYIFYKDKDYLNIISE